ncbi:nucleotidyltransferase family protein [Actinomycetes bacterium M1A6_2h]
MAMDVQENRAARDFVVRSVAAVATGTLLPVADEAKHAGWVDCAVRSGLGPVIAHRRQADGVVELTELTACMRTAALTHLMRLADLRKVKAALDSAGVRWLVFKGPAVAELTYPAPGTRTYNDLDILIHPADFEQGLNALLDGPARLADQNWKLIATREQGEISLVVGHSVIDLHWHFFSSLETRAQFDLDIRIPIDNAVPVRMGGMEVRTLDPIDTAIFLATHAVLSGGHKLKWLYDFHCAVSKIGTESEVFAERTRRYNAGLIVSVMSSRTEQFLGVQGISPALTGGSRLWRSMCGVVSTFAPPEADFLDNYTGRAVFSATRNSARDSIRELWTNSVQAARSGHDRRSTIVDRTVLHNPGGTLVDRDRWLDMVSSFG